MSVRSKLLEAVGEIDIHDIGESALVDILVNKIKSQEKRIQELNGENAHERQRLHDEREAMHKDRQEMRRNPLYGVYGQFYFLGRDNQRIQLVMQSGQIVSMIERFKNTDFMMRQITPTQWDILEEQDQTGKRK